MDLKASNYVAVLDSLCNLVRAIERAFVSLSSRVVFSNNLSNPRDFPQLTGASCALYMPLQINHGYVASGLLLFLGRERSDIVNHILKMPQLSSPYILLFKANPMLAPEF